MQSLSPKTIGIDFDNTIVSYNELIYSAARQRGLISSDVMKNKKEIRDAIRKLPDGEIEWQKLQAFVYGRGMGKAALMEGVEEFFDFCKRSNVPTFIISHKTQFASMDTERIDLRKTAMRWMRQNKFFDKNGLGLAVDDVYFKSTRQEKIDCIGALGCTHFIDDLEETFLGESFPDQVEKILFSPQETNINLKNIRVFQAWDQIHDYFSGN